MNLRDLKIGIIGGGVVGKATAGTYLEHVDDVRVYDRVDERRTHDLGTVLCCDLIFVCLPEDKVAEWFANTSQAIAQGRHRTCTQEQFQALFLVIRSTMPIGTTEQLSKEHGAYNLVHSPEFLTQRCAMTDALIPARHIIGIPKQAVHRPSNDCSQRLAKLYEMRFPGTPVQVMTSDESEAVKLMTNAALASKVSLFNEFSALVLKLGLDWEHVHQGIISDPRIGTSHTQVPGHDGQKGFDGKCLPKDLKHLIDCYEKHKVEHPILNSVNFRNSHVDRPANLK